MNDTKSSQSSENAPEIVLRDGNLRSATWRSEGEYGPLFNIRITKLYRDDDGNRRETPTLSSKDLLRASELARETHQEVLKRQRELAKERTAERDEKQPSFSEEWHDDTQSRDEIKPERFKQERQPSRAKARKRQSR